MAKKIALYYPWIYLTSGVERMILEMVRRSRHNWIIYTSHFYPEQTYPELRNLDIVELDRVPVSRKYFAVSNAATTILNQKIDLKGFDAFMVSSEGLGDLITFRNHSVPVICYCHTPMKVIHDEFTRARYLEGNYAMYPLYQCFARLFKIIDKRAWKNYQYVFCNSEEVRQRIINARLASEDKLEVLHPGLDTECFKPNWEYKKYFLVAGRIKWFKNIELAIDSYLEFKKEHPQFSEFKLVIAGRVEPRSEGYLQELILSAKGDNSIIFHRDPSDEQLFKLYKSAYCLLFTSLNEDWGMVPLEAMGFGKPVIAVNRGGPVESIRDGVDGYLVEPNSKKFSEAMSRFANDIELVHKFGAAAADNVKKYDWQHFVGRIDEYLDSL